MLSIRILEERICWSFVSWKAISLSIAVTPQSESIDDIHWMYNIFSLSTDTKTELHWIEL